MALPESHYIDQQDGALRIAGTRVGLDMVIAGFQEGESPEQTVEQLPTLTLAQVYGAIAYYLENKDAVDAFFSEVDRKFKERVRPLSETDPELYARLMEARKQMASKHS
jgi:uncharacterized protein (DUF433 family)